MVKGLMDDIHGCNQNSNSYPLRVFFFGDGRMRCMVLSGNPKEIEASLWGDSSQMDIGPPCPHDLWQRVIPPVFS